MSHKVKRLFSIFYITFCSVLIIAPVAPVEAFEMPGLFQTEAADKSKINRGYKKFIDFVLYIAAGGGAATAAAGLVICLPLFGRKDKGIDWMKNGSLVIVGSLLFYGVLYYIGTLFS